MASQGTTLQIPAVHFFEKQGPSSPAQSAGTMHSGSAPPVPPLLALEPVAVTVLEAVVPPPSPPLLALELTEELAAEVPLPPPPFVSAPPHPTTRSPRCQDYTPHCRRQYEILTWRQLGSTLTHLADRGSDLTRLTDTPVAIVSPMIDLYRASLVACDVRLILRPQPAAAPSVEIDWSMVGWVGGAVLFIAFIVTLSVLNNAAEKRRAAARKVEFDKQAADEQARLWTWQAHETARMQSAQAAEAARVAAWNADINRRSEEKRRELHQRLTSRFGSEAAGRIMRVEIWPGQTAEMLIEARGQPHDIDERVMKTKTKHVYKYGWLSGNRYGLRVTLENGVVVGWDDKM